MLRCGVITQTGWIKKNVNLQLLCLSIRDFLEEKGFSVRLDESLGKTALLASVKTISALRVLVSGVPEDFVVSFESEGKRDRLVRIFLPFLTMMGLGFFVRKELRLQEFHKDLEREFWSFMERKINELANTAG